MMAAAGRRTAPAIVAVAAIALLIGLALMLRHVESAARAGQKRADTAAVAIAQREQEIADLKQAVATERRRAAITEEKNDALSSRLADARGSVAAYVERMRDETDRGGGPGGDLPGLSDGAGRADEADPHTRISVTDLGICAENTIRLANAQGWLREQQRGAP
jgi:hypothetical protein